MPDSLLPAFLPDFDAGTITSEQFNDAITQYSVVLLRNAVPLERVAFMRKLVVATYEEYDRLLASFIAGKDIADEIFYTRDVLYSKNMLESNNSFRRYGSIPLSHLLMVTEEVIHTISSFRFMPFIGEFLKGKPMLALNSSSIRKGDPHTDTRCLFHQDGQFLGGVENKTINTWVALDDCGVDAPGVEFIPYRVPEILESGVNGVDMPWEILDDAVYNRFGGKGAGWAPVIKAGDVVAFDQMNIHRTHVAPGMTRERYALECWLFPAIQGTDQMLLAAF